MPRCRKHAFLAPGIRARCDGRCTMELGWIVSTTKQEQKALVQAAPCRSSAWRGAGRQRSTSATPHPTPPYPYSTPCTCQRPRQRVSWRAKVALRARSGGHAGGAACRAAPGTLGLGPEPWLSAQPAGGHAPAAPGRAPLPERASGSRASKPRLPAPPGERGLMGTPELSVDGDGATVNRPRISDDILCISAPRPASAAPPAVAAASAEIAIEDPLPPAALPGGAGGFCARHGKRPLSTPWDAV